MEIAAIVVAIVWFAICIKLMMLMIRWRRSRNLKHRERKMREDKLRAELKEAGY